MPFLQVKIQKITHFQRIYALPLCLTKLLAAKPIPFLPKSNKINHPLLPAHSFIIDFFKFIIKMKRFIIENDDSIIE
jgi:hypothetical protein